MTRLPWPLVAFLVACADSESTAKDGSASDTSADCAEGAADCEDTDTGTAVDTGGDTATGECSGTAPTITDLTVYEGDPTTDDEGNPIPALYFDTTFSDADGDAHIVTIVVWVDTVVDGTVDESASPLSEAGPVQLTLDGVSIPECEGEGGRVIFALGITGRGLSYDTEYEFAVAVADASGMVSSSVVVGATTPSALE